LEIFQRVKLAKSDVVSLHRVRLDEIDGHIFHESFCHGGWKIERLTGFHLSSSRNKAKGHLRQIDAAAGIASMPSAPQAPSRPGLAATRWPPTGLQGLG
jgi:hypothetical protein